MISLLISVLLLPIGQPGESDSFFKQYQSFVEMQNDKYANERVSAVRKIFKDVESRTNSSLLKGNKLFMIDNYGYELCDDTTYVWNKNVSCSFTICPVVNIDPHLKTVRAHINALFKRKFLRFVENADTAAYEKYAHKNFMMHVGAKFTVAERRGDHWIFRQSGWFNTSVTRRRFKYR